MEFNYYVSIYLSSIYFVEILLECNMNHLLRKDFFDKGIITLDWINVSINFQFSINLSDAVITVLETAIVNLLENP